MKDFKYSQLHNLSVEELQELSNSIREEIIEAVSINGGHLGSSLGVVETIVALHKSFDFPKDKIVFDVGHQSYAHKILSGRSLDNLRRQNGVSGFQKMAESEFDPYDAGHSSTSISACMGLACARDLNHEDYNVLAFIGDASISNGITFEALNQIKEFNHKIIIILNDNNMSISSTNGALHQAFKGVNYNIFEELGFKFMGPINGYDFEEMAHTFEEAKKETRSVIINVSTIKGKGYKYSEMDDDGFWHGVAPFDIATGKPKAIVKEGYASWSKIYARGLEQIMEQDEKSIIITPATTLGSYLRRIMKNYPSRAFDVGISEEHASILANSLALSGFKPFVSIYSTFLQRSYDEILHDNARMNGAVTYLVDRAGLVGEDGETHQGIYDVAMVSSIPNTSIAMAKDQEQAYSLLKFSLSFNHPLFIRYSKQNVEYDKELKVSNSKNIEYGKWEIENEGRNTCIITMGEKVNEFKDNGATIINACWLNPIDEEMLDKILSYKQIIVYDPFSTINGISLHISNYLAKNGYNGKLIIKALPNDFISQGTVLEQEERYNLTVDNIKALIK